MLVEIANSIGIGDEQYDVARPVVFIRYPHSNPHPSQMGRV
jgi:hypothetical protein